MNLAHLKTIVWLRWRLAANQFRKIGKGHRIFSIILLVLGLIGTIGLFLAAWLGSSRFLSVMSAEVTLIVWAVIVAVFLFTWAIGVLTDLQRSEPLSLAHFLHLPVSPTGAFLCNFATSFINFSTILIFPLQLGLTFGMIRVFGPRMIPGILILAAFLLMVSALTYQFRGWLALMMVNKRRRRTIITVFTFSVILLSQLPNLLNMTAFSGNDKEKTEWKVKDAQAKDELTQQLEDQEITEREFRDSVDAIDKAAQARKDQRIAAFAWYVRIGCMVVPFGWLAVGMESLVAGQSWQVILVPLLTGGGMLAIAWASLARSYRSTLRLYRGEIGQPSGATPQSAPKDNLPDTGPARTSRLLEMDFPLLNSHQSAVTAGTIAGVLRAPEAKMALLTPFAIMLLLGVSFAWRDGDSLPVAFRSFTGIGVVSFAMLGIMQMINNQFGFDRDGFRCMILSPIRRVDILIGKNMGYAPFAIGIGAIGIVAMQIFIPMPWTHFLATFVQLGSVYLITCMVANLMSIKAPLAVASGTMKPVNMNVSIVVLQLLITLLLPVGLLPTMIPPAIELLVQSTTDLDAIPIYLLLSVVLLIATVFVYRIVVRAQATMLLEREQQILETVTQVGS